MKTHRNYSESLLQDHLSKVLHPANQVSTKDALSNRNDWRHRAKTLGMVKRPEKSFYEALNRKEMEEQIAQRKRMVDVLIKEKKQIEQNLATVERKRQEKKDSLEKQKKLFY
jgi:hypothetical protein